MQQQEREEKQINKQKTSLKILPVQLMTSLTQICISKKKKKSCKTLPNRLNLENCCSCCSLMF